MCVCFVSNDILCSCYDTEAIVELAVVFRLLVMVTNSSTWTWKSLLQCSVYMYVWWLQVSQYPEIIEFIVLFFYFTCRDYWYLRPSAKYHPQENNVMSRTLYPTHNVKAFKVILSSTGRRPEEVMSWRGSRACVRPSVNLFSFTG